MKGQYGRRIEFYTHRKYGGKIPIYLNQAGTFHAVIGDLVLSANTKTELIKMTDEALKNQTDLKWIPIIEISFGSRWHVSRDRDEQRNSHETTVQLEFKRFWIAQKIDKHWIEAHWDTERYEYGKTVKIETGDRLERSRGFIIDSNRNKATGQYDDITDFKLPYTKHDDSSETSVPVHYVSYTEDLWKALIEVDARLEALQGKIIELLGSEKNRNMLTQNVAGLLPAPKKGKNK